MSGCLCGHGEWCRRCSPNTDYPVRIPSPDVIDMINFFKLCNVDTVGYILAEKAAKFQKMLEYEL